MQIVLLILKIVGILLLALLTLLVLLLLTVLFVPVRYRVSGYHWPDRGTALHGRVSWFLSLIRVEFGYEKEGYFRLKLLGITCKRRTPKPEASKPKLPEQELPGQDSSRQEASKQGLPETGLQKKEQETGGPADRPASGNKVSSVPADAGRTDAGIANAAKSAEKVPSWRKKCLQWKENIKDGLRGLQEKREKVGCLIDFLRLPEVREAIKLFLRQIKGLLKHIGPRKVYLKGRFGFDDPSLTGQITGILSLLPLAYREGISVTPDFEEACLEGEFSVRGCIRVASLLALALKIWFDDNFRKAYQKWKEM